MLEGDKSEESGDTLSDLSLTGLPVSAGAEAQEDAEDATEQLPGDPM